MGNAQTFGRDKFCWGCLVSFDVLGKYKSIVVSIALFLLLDASVLLLNFYISFEISEDASAVNVAGRQRMLSQRMVKSLMNIQYFMDDDVNRVKAMDELVLTANLFDTTLIAFNNGGEATGADGEKIELAPVTVVAGVQSIQKAQKIWLPYKVKLDELLTITDTAHLPEPLLSTIQYANENNLTLLTLMNTLTGSLEGVASSKASRLRMIQTIGISLAILNFFIIMFHFLRQLRESDAKVESARQETVEILDTVNEGLFLIDKDLNLGSQYSKKLLEMFGQAHIDNISFKSLLQHTVNKKDLDTAERFLHLLYREDIKSELITDLNPLKSIQVSISNPDGTFTQKFFSFSFSRVYKGNVIKDILTTVRDVTEEMRLAKELEHSKKQNEQQFTVLNEILYGNPEAIAAFLDNCFTSFERINDLLRRPAKSSAALKAKLVEICVETHHLKGESGALELYGFETLSHDFETDIVRISALDNLSGDHFLPLIVEFEKMIRYAESMQLLSRKLSSFSAVEVTPEAVAAPQNEWQHLYNLVDTVSARYGKNVELIMSGLTEVTLSRDLRDLLNDISIQCIRNSIIHGIEVPEKRTQANKPTFGRIDIRLVQTANGDFEFNYSDDGAGINYEAIRQKAIESGRWNDADITSWDTKKLMTLLFHPGISTAANVTKDAGRGVGMAVIRSKVKEMNGKIKVGSRKGINTHISILLPALMTTQVA